MEFVKQMPDKSGRGRKRNPKFDNMVKEIMTGKPCKFTKEDDFPTSSRSSFRYVLKQRAQEAGIQIITRTVKEEPDALYVILAEAMIEKKE